MSKYLTPPRRGVSGCVAAVLVAAAASVVLAPSADAAVSPIANRPASGVTADALPTVQIDGVVWSQAVVGNTVFAGGSFANARPAGAASGTNLIPRANFLSYDLTTGVLNSSFAPSLNGQVKAVVASPDGTRVYVGGAFTTADGVNRYRLAAYDTATGALISSFHPTLDATVNSITATNTTVYAGGIFSNANGVARSRLAAFSAATGATLAWAPTADSTVNAVQLTPNGSAVVVGGSFQNINGSSALGLASIDASTGTSVPFAINQVVQDYGTNGAILSLSSDGTSIFGTGYTYGSPSNFEGTFSANPATGAINWLADCHGDTYGAFSTGSQVYVVSHEHYCANIGAFQDTRPNAWYRSTSFTANATGTVLANGQGGSGYGNFAGQPSPSMINWYPTIDIGSYTGQSQGAWTVSGNSQYVVEGGEFLHVNGTAQQGLVRFAVPSIAPNLRGPQDTSSTTAPTLSADFNSVVNVSWPANWDQDDANLTYQLFRGNVNTPIYTTTAVSQFWNRPTLTYRDTGLSPGTTYTYWIKASDPSGNVVRTGNVTVTTPTNMPTATPPTDTYGKAVYADAPSLYWRLDDTSGTTAADASDYNVTGTYTGGYTQNVASPVSGSGTAVTLDGSSGAIGSNRSYVNPTAYSEELWFKTTSTSGGKLIGFGDQQSAISSHYDRQVYMTRSGQLDFGAYTGQTNVITSPSSYNDGQWHQVVATEGASGMNLYVDGSLVGTNANTGSENYTGYWRLGGDNLNGWPDAGNYFFAGTIDEAAVYLGVLTPAQVRTHYKASPIAFNVTPNAVATATCSTAGSCAFDGSGSNDPDGTIASYAWAFGDGSSGNGAKPTHTYAQSGTYTATLTVTDNSGATAVTTTTVTVTVPVNQSPAASFTSSCTNLDCTFDGSASNDADGTVASYAWTYGDGSTANTSKPAYSYSAGGTYTVTLTVTDNQGATNSVSHTVTVSGIATYASDAFGRTTTSGWGTADKGGAWTVSGGAASFATGAGVATMKLGVAGTTLTAALNGVSQTNTVQTVDVSPDKVAIGNGYFLNLRSRVSGTSAYQVKVRLLPSGVVHLVVSKVVSGTETVFKEVNVPGVTYNLGDTLRLQARVMGDGTTTTLAATVWKVGTTQPATAQLTQTDTDPTLQGAGTFGIQGYLSGSATNAPVTLSVDNYSVTSN